VRRKLLFYALLAAATLGLSEFLSAWRAWRAAPTIDAAAAVVAIAVGHLRVGARQARRGGASRRGLADRSPVGRAG